MVSTAELTSMKAVLEGALTQCVTETIKAKPANPVLFLAHRLIQYAQMPPVDPLKAAAPSKPAATKAAEPAGEKPKRRTSKAWAPNQSLAQDAKTTLEHNSKLDIYSQAATLRNCSIICTIGPKVQDVESLHMLRQAGMQICRMNFSHGSYEYHGGVITNMRECLAKYPMDGRLCAIALDTKGPEIRTGMNIEEETQLTAGDTITVTTDVAKREKQDKDTLFVDYANICNVMKEGQTIFVDDGLLSLKVEKVDAAKGELTCKIVNTVKLGSRKGCNLPNVNVDLPALSEKDKADLKFSVEQGVDMVFASFIRKASDVPNTNPYPA